MRGRSQPYIVETLRSFNALETLVRNSSSEGYGHVQRLFNELREGINRFDRPKEFLIGVREDVGVGEDPGDYFAVVGVNDNGDGRGRLRRFYVSPQRRGLGWGRYLAELCCARARNDFDVMVVNAGTDSAAAFYDYLGWQRSVERGITHLRQITLASVPPLPGSGHSDTLHSSDR